MSCLVFSSALLSSYVSVFAVAGIVFIQAVFHYSVRTACLCWVRSSHSFSSKIRGVNKFDHIQLYDDDYIADDIKQ